MRRSEAVLVALIGLVGAIIGGCLGGAFTYLATNRQMSVQMVQIAVGILSAKPEDNIRPAREWAVDVIVRYSDVPLTQSTRVALLNNPIPVDSAQLLAQAGITAEPLGTATIGDNFVLFPRTTAAAEALRNSGLSPTPITPDLGGWFLGSAEAVSPHGKPSTGQPNE